MNILLVTPYFPPQTGGVVTFVDTIQRMLQQKGHRAYVLVPGASHQMTACQGPKHSDSQVYEVYLRTPWVPTAPGKGLVAFVVYFLSTLWKLRKFVREKSIDLVCLEYPLPYMYYFCLLKSLANFKLVVGIHGSDVLSLPSAPRHEQWLVKKIIRSADVLLAHSRSLMSQAEASIKRLGKFRLHIPYGIEPNKLRGVLKSGSARANVPPTPYILTVAKLHERKGLDVLLRAIRMIDTGEDRYRFVLVGDGPEESALKRLATKLGIEAQVIFTGELQPEAIVKLYDGCEFFVLPSRSEPFGIVLLEAMAFGKAIVATEVGGVPEVVADGVSGILVPPNDPAALADGITRLITNPELRSQIGENGSRLVENHFDFRVVVEQYEKIFQQVCASKAISG